MKRATYRLLISVLFRIIVLIGLVFALVPFIDTVFFDDKPLNSNKNNIVEVNLTGLQVGQIKKIKIAYVPVWIYKRRDTEIAQLDLLSELNKKSSLLADPISEFSIQANSLHDSYRSHSARYFVFKPIESIRSCTIRYLDNSSSKMDSQFTDANLEWMGGFTESCFGSVYDLAGRRYRGTGKDNQQNLSVPDYKIQENSQYNSGHQSGNKTANKSGNNSRQQGDVIQFDFNSMVVTQ